MWEKSIIRKLDDKYYGFRDAVTPCSWVLGKGGWPQFIYMMEKRHIIEQVFGLDFEFSKVPIDVAIISWSYSDGGTTIFVLT